MTGVGRAISRFATIPSSSPKQGAGGAAPAGGTGGVPLYLKTLEGGAGGIAAQAKPNPPLKDSAGHNKTIRPADASCPYPRTRRKVRKLPPPSPKRGAGGAAPAGGTASPPVSKNVGGRSGRDGGAGQAKTIRPHRRADAGVRVSATPPLQNTNDCAIVPPMKWATSPLLFLGACRIHEYCANHGESPCGRGAEGTPQGARPSEDGRDRSDCRCKAQALYEPPNSVTARKIGNGSVTTGNRSVTAV